jgi:hypothetical protein
MGNQRILGMGLIALNIVVWFIAAMMVWKSRHVDTYVYEDQR